MVRFIAVVSLLVGLSSCGRNACDALSDAFSGLVKKQGRCALTLTVNAASCDTAFADGRCLPSDDSALNRVADCLTRMPDCAPGLEAAFISQFETCRLSSPRSLTCSF